MSDEEILRAFLGDGVDQDDEGLDYVNRSAHEALSRILSDRDSLRAWEARAAASMDRCCKAVGIFPHDMAAATVEGLAADRDSLRAACCLDEYDESGTCRHRALTSSEKEGDPGPIGTKPLLSKVDVDEVERRLRASSEKEKG